MEIPKIFKKNKRSKNLVIVRTKLDSVEKTILHFTKLQIVHNCSVSHPGIARKPI